MKTVRAGLLAAVAAASFAASPVLADIRPFAFVKDAIPLGPGGFEYEQYNTWNYQTEEDNAFHELEFKHEFEFGVAENFDLGVYFPNWSYTHENGTDSTQYDGAAIEGVVYLSSPITDPLGVALYVEAGVGEDSLSYEGKLLLQKDINKWTLAYNLVAETEIEGVFDEDAENETEGELENLFGAVYHVTDQFRVGGELLIESEFPDWSDHEHTVVYLGPTFGYNLFADKVMVNFVLTPTVQLTSEEEAARFKTRLLLEVEF